MAEAALFYPRMHVENADWLKGALLLFDQVRRMVPPDLPVENRADILPFTQPHGGGRRLLESANLRSERVSRALEALAIEIKQDARSAKFRRAFGREAAPQGMSADDYGYQIHVGKFGHELISTLDEAKLSWAPRRAEPYHYWSGYIEVHPRIGEAIMSTLAIACAKGEGLSIITDDNSEPLHDCLVRQEGERVYETWVRGDVNLPDPRKPTGPELFECLVTIACDTSKLDTQELAKMKSDREPLRRLLEKLDDRAKSIDAMDDGPGRKQRLRNEVADILNEWERDRANMSPFFRRFFGMGLLDPSAKFADRVATGLSNAAVAGSAGMSTTTMLGAQYGLGIGVITHAAKSAADTVSAKRNNPYALLSTMAREGVVFRSSADVRARAD